MGTGGGAVLFFADDGDGLAVDHRDTKDGATGAIPVALAVGEVGLVVDVGKGVALGAHIHSAFAAGADVIIADKQWVGKHCFCDETATNFELRSEL